MKFKIAANTLSQLAGKIITTGVSLLATVLIAKNYGPENYGNFTLITTYVVLFYLISDFGFNAVVLEKIQNTEVKKTYFSNILGLRIVWSILLVFFCISLLAFLPQNHGFVAVVRLGIIIYSLSIISQGLTTTANLIFQSKLRYDQSTIALFFGSAFSLLLILLFTNQKLPIIFIVLSFLLGNIATSFISLFLARINDKELSLTPAFDVSKYKEIFVKSMPLGFTLILNLIYFRADTFILATTRTQAEVGNYGLAYRFFEAILVFPSFFMNSVYPLFLSVKYSPQKLINLASKSFKILLITSILASAVILISANQLILFSGGSLFKESTTALRILALSFPSFFLSSLYMWLLITLGKRKILAIVYGLSMILNIVLNLIFIPLFGIPAAAFTTLIGETIILICTYLLSKKYILQNYD